MIVAVKKTARLPTNRTAVLQMGKEFVIQRCRKVVVLIQRSTRKKVVLLPTIFRCFIYLQSRKLPDDVIVTFSVGNLHGSEALFVPHVHPTVVAHEQANCGGVAVLDSHVEGSVSSLHGKEMSLSSFLIEAEFVCARV